MFEFNVEQIKEVLNVVVFGVIAFVGGGISYLSSTVANKNTIVWGDMFIKALSSGFAGMIIGWLLIYLNYPMTLICAFSGIAGYVGAEVTISLIKRKIFKNLGLENEHTDTKSNS